MVALDVAGRYYPCHRFIFYDRGQDNYLLGQQGEGGSPLRYWPLQGHH